MTVWHDLRKCPPEEQGYYLTVSNFDPEETRNGKPYGAISICEYFPEGEEITIYANSHYQGLSPEQRLLKIIMNPDVVRSIGAFYETDEKDLPYPLTSITHWAKLPDLPDEYGGDQNDYYID